MKISHSLYSSFVKICSYVLSPALTALISAKAISLLNDKASIGLCSFVGGAAGISTSTLVLSGAKILGSNLQLKDIRSVVYSSLVEGAVSSFSASFDDTKAYNSSIRAMLLISLLSASIFMMSNLKKAKLIPPLISAFTFGAIAQNGKIATASIVTANVALAKVEGVAISELIYRSLSNVCQFIIHPSSIKSVLSPYVLATAVSQGALLGLYGAYENKRLSGITVAGFGVIASIAGAGILNAINLALDFKKFNISQSI